MINLIKVELSTIFKRFDIKMTIIICMFLGIYLGIMNNINETIFCEGIFEWVLILCLFLSALSGLYISRDYTQNTIRNKVIVGHSRLNIYLSKQLAVTTFYLVSILLYILTMTITNYILIGSNNINLDAFKIGIVITIFSTIAISTITTIISMSSKTEVGGLMPLLILFILFIFSALGMEIFDKEMMTSINEILPTGQIMLLNLIEKTTNSTKMILSSITISLSCITSGYLIFKNSDLN